VVEISELWGGGCFAQLCSKVPRQTWQSSRMDSFVKYSKTEGCFPSYYLYGFHRFLNVVGFSSHGELLERNEVRESCWIISWKSLTASLWHALHTLQFVAVDCFSVYCNVTVICYQSDWVTYLLNWVRSCSGVTRVGVTRGSNWRCHPIFSWQPFFSHRHVRDDLFSCRLVTTPTFRPRLSSVLCKFSNKIFNSIRVSPPLEGVTRGGPHPQWRHCILGKAARCANLNCTCDDVLMVLEVFELIQWSLKPLMQYSKVCELVFVVKWERYIQHLK